MTSNTVAFTVEATKSTNISDFEMQDKNLESWNYGTIYFVEAALILGAIVMICCIIVMMRFLQKLNYKLKMILIALCTHNAISFTINAILFGINSSDMDEVTCSVMNILQKSLTDINIEHLALVSFVRYYLSSKTAKNENPNIQLIISLVAAEYVIEYSITILLSQVTTTPFEVSCLQGSSLNPSGAILIIQGLKVSLILIIGISFDYMLVVFLKKRNQMSIGSVGQAKLIPWKTNFEEYDFLVPVSASVISVLVTITMVVLILVYFQDTQTFLSFNLGTVTIPSCLIVAQLALTMRVTKSARPPPIIKRRLNFHENQHNHNEFEVSQDMFHHAQLEQDKFRRKKHSVAGHHIKDTLQKVSEKLQAQQDVGQFEMKVNIIHVRPINDDDDQDDDLKMVAKIHKKEKNINEYEGEELDEVFESDKESPEDSVGKSSNTKNSEAVMNLFHYRKAGRPSNPNVSLDEGSEEMNHLQEIILNPAHLW